MKLTKAQREELRMKFGGRCAYCGEILESGWCADHVEPICRSMKYGTDPKTGYRRLIPSGECYHPDRDIEKNLYPSCRSCNIHKGSFALQTWRRDLEDLTGVLKRGYPTYRHALRFGQLIDNSHPVVFWFENYQAKDVKHEGE